MFFNCSTLLKFALFGASVGAIRTTLVSELEAQMAMQAQTECKVDECGCGCNLTDMCDCSAETEGQQQTTDGEHAQVEEVDEKSLTEINEEITQDLYEATDEAIELVQEENEAVQTEVDGAVVEEILADDNSEEPLHVESHDLQPGLESTPTGDGSGQDFQSILQVDNQIDVLEKYVEMLIVAAEGLTN